MCLATKNYIFANMISVVRVHNVQFLYDQVDMNFCRSMCHQLSENAYPKSGTIHDKKRLPHWIVKSFVIESKNFPCEKAIKYLTRYFSVFKF